MPHPGFLLLRSGETDLECRFCSRAPPGALSRIRCLKVLSGASSGLTGRFVDTIFRAQL